MTKAVSLFSGCGGLDLGFRWAGFDIVWAIDCDKDACMTYEKNLGGRILCEDISAVDFDDVPDCDIMIGGPPCQAFSLIGKRDFTDRNFVMIWEFVRAVREKMPHAFVMENVPGLRSAKDSLGRNVLELFLKRMRGLGYSLTFSVVNAADYGVPQRRKRLVVLGSRGTTSILTPPRTHSEDLEGMNPGLKRWVSVKEAIGDLPNPSVYDEFLGYAREPQPGYQEWVRGDSNGVYNHWMPTMSELDRRIIDFIPEGGNYMDVPNSIPSRRIKNYKKTGGRTTTYGRLERNEPAYTINTYFSRLNVGCNIHYSKDRLITIREGLRLQSFRDDFVLPHGLSKRAQYMVVGNAVPPLLGHAIAKSLKSQLMEVTPLKIRKTMKSK